MCARAHVLVQARVLVRAYASVGARKDWRREERSRAGGATAGCCGAAVLQLSCAAALRLAALRFYSLLYSCPKAGCTAVLQVVLLFYGLLHCSTAPYAQLLYSLLYCSTASCTVLQLLACTADLQPLVQLFYSFLYCCTAHCTVLQLIVLFYSFLCCSKASFSASRNP